MTMPMKRCALLIALLAFFLVSGCAPTVSRQQAPLTAAAPSFSQSAATPSLSDIFASSENDGFSKEAFFSHLVLMKSAWAAIGTPYVRGGVTPAGFDCSGFVQWTYRHVGVDLPRTAREQSAVGEAIKKKEELRVGDIVAFRHPRRGYHTGIYIGEGKFIHSPRTRSVVKVSSLDDAYFRSTFLGARRIDFTKDIQAQLAPRDYLTPPATKKAAKTAGMKKSAAKAKTKATAQTRKARNIPRKMTARVTQKKQR